MTNDTIPRPGGGRVPWPLRVPPAHHFGEGDRFRNVRHVGEAAPPSQISGRDGDHRVEDVTFENLRIGGEVITDPAAGRFSINEHTHGIGCKGE